MNKSLAVPGSEHDVPRDIEDRLKQIDPDLFLKRIRTPNLDSGAGESWGQTERITYTDRLALCIKWGERDPRRARIFTGEFAPENAFDLLSVLPADMPYEQVPGHLLATMRRMPNARRFMDDISKWNEDQKLRNMSGVFEYGEDVIDRVNHFRKRGKDTAEIPDPTA